MAERPRYRVEHGRWCIDITVRRARQLFDSRDPSLFRERDLDEQAVEYLIGSAREIHGSKPLAIIITLTEPLEPPLTAEVLTEAVHSHFTYQLAQLNRQLEAHWRRGRGFLAVGLTVLAVFLALAEIAETMLAAGALRDILRVGLVITGWVAMWRPLKVLIYDWRPLVEERRQVQRLLDAPVLVREGTEAGQA